MKGTPLVAVHGWGMSPAHFGDFPNVLAATLAGDLGETIEAHCPSLPGHGGAPEAPGWSVESLAAKWVDRWPGAIWVGWSLGAQVALAAAANAPERVRALVLIGATPCFVERDGWSAGMTAPRFRNFRSSCLEDSDATRTRFLGLTMRGDRDGRAGLRTLRALDAAATPPGREALLEGLRVLAVTDLVGDLPAIGCPTLWLTGAHDAVVTPSAAEHSARSQPQARVSCLPGAGHAPFLTHGQETVESTHNWFKEIRG